MTGASCDGTDAEPRTSTHVAQLAEAQRSKEFATLQAAAALREIAVTPTTTDRDLPAYVVSMGAYCRTVESLAELQALLARMGVRA